MHNRLECWSLINDIYRDLNSLFVRDCKDGKWYETNSDLSLEATYFARKQNIRFNVSEFFWEFYQGQEKGTGYVFGNVNEKNELIKKRKGYLRLITLHVDNPKVHSFIVRIDKYKPFFAPPQIIRKYGMVY